MADLNTTDDKKSKNIFISQSIFPNYILLREPKRNSKSVNTISVLDTKNHHKNPALPPKAKQSVVMKSKRVQNQPIIHSMFPKINQDPYFVQTLQLLKKRRHSNLIIGEHISNKHKNSANLSLLNTNLNSIEQCLKKKKQYLIQLNKMKKTGQLNCGLYGHRVQMIDFLGQINENVADEEKTENKQRCQEQSSIQKMKINQLKQKRYIAVKHTKKVQRSQRIKTQLSKDKKKSPKSRQKTRQTPQFISINKINILQPFKIQTQYLHLIKIYTQKTKEQNKDSPNKQQDIKKKQQQQSNVPKIKVIKNNKRKNKKIVPNSFALAEGQGISPWQSFTNNFLDKLM